MEKELENALSSLTGEILKTNAYQEYDRLAALVRKDPVNYRLLRRYELAQMELQTAALSGTQAPEEIQKEFSRLNLVLFDQEQTAAYLMAKMKYEQMLGGLIHRISEIRPASGWEGDLDGTE